MLRSTKHSFERAIVSSCGSLLVLRTFVFQIDMLQHQPQAMDFSVTSNTHVRRTLFMLASQSSVAQDQHWSLEMSRFPDHSNHRKESLLPKQQKYLEQESQITAD